MAAYGLEKTTLITGQMCAMGGLNLKILEAVSHLALPFLGFLRLGLSNTTIPTPITGYPSRRNLTYQKLQNQCLQQPTKGLSHSQPPLDRMSALKSYVNDFEHMISCIECTIKFIAKFRLYSYVSVLALV